jgi:FtsH-binding integral membrane protein
LIIIFSLFLFLFNNHLLCKDRNNIGKKKNILPFYLLNFPVYIFMIANINTFSWSQMLSNSNGKTSASAVAGISTTFVGLFGFLMGAVFFIYAKDGSIMMYSSALVGTGVGVLGYRKSKDAAILPENIDNVVTGVDAITAKTSEGEEPADVLLKS